MALLKLNELEVGNLAIIDFMVKGIKTSSVYVLSVVFLTLAACSKNSFNLPTTELADDTALDSPQVSIDSAPVEIRYYEDFSIDITVAGFSRNLRLSDISFTNPDVSCEKELQKISSNLYKLQLSHCTGHGTSRVEIQIGSVTQTTDEFPILAKIQTNRDCFFTKDPSSNVTFGDFTSAASVDMVLGTQLFEFSNNPPAVNDSASEVNRYGGSGLGWFDGNYDPMSDSTVLPNYFILRTLPSSTTGSVDFSLSLPEGLSFQGCFYKNPYPRPWSKMTARIVADSKCYFQKLSTDTSTLGDLLSLSSDWVKSTDYTQDATKLFNVNTAVPPKNLTDLVTASDEYNLTNDSNLTGGVQWNHVNDIIAAAPSSRNTDLLSEFFVIQTDAAQPTIALDLDQKFIFYGCQLNSYTPDNLLWYQSLSWSGGSTTPVEFHYQVRYGETVKLSDFVYSGLFESASTSSGDRQVEILSYSDLEYGEVPALGQVPDVVYFKTQDGDWRMVGNETESVSADTALSPFYIVRSRANNDQELLTAYGLKSISYGSSGYGAGRVRPWDSP